jgi:hypothetical protein
MKIRGKLTIIRAPNKTVFFCFLMFSFVFLIGRLAAKNSNTFLTVQDKRMYFFCPISVKGNMYERFTKD